MTIDATFWVAVSFLIFCGVLVYLKVPQKINNGLINEINKIKKELNEADKLKVEAKNLLSDYENKIDKSKKEAIEILNLAKKNSEKTVLDKTEKFHKMMDNKKRITEEKISQMKNNALKEIKNIAAKVSIQTVEHLIKNSIDKSKIEKIHLKSLEETKNYLKKTKS